MNDKVNLAEKFTQFHEQWSPKIIGQVNDAHVKIARIQGEFVWHQHGDTDELFLVVQGVLTMHFRDRDVVLHEGEMIVVPRGVEHKPAAADKCHILMIERAGTLNTGDVIDERTHEDPEWI